MRTFRIRLHFRKIEGSSLRGRLTRGNQETRFPTAGFVSLGLATGVMV